MSVKIDILPHKLDWKIPVRSVPNHVRIEADIRLPVGVEKEQVIAVVERVLKGYPQVKMSEINFSPPSWCEPNHEMVEYLQKNANARGWYEPATHRQPRWYRRAPVALPKHTSLRIWSTADRHGLLQRVCGNRGISPCRPLSRLERLRLPKPREVTCRHPITSLCGH